jgi:hypothetical protein
MNAYAKLATEAGDQYLAAVAQAQENFLKTVAMFRPYLPDVAVAPRAALPGMPSPEEVVEVSFTFAEKLLKQQQDFAAKLLATPETRIDATIPKSPPPKTKSGAAAN